jgi:hypothetical protein
MAYIGLLKEAGDFNSCAIVLEKKYYNIVKIVIGRFCI